MNIVILYRTNGGIVTATYNGRSITVDQNDEWVDVSYDVSTMLGVKWREDSDDHDRVVQAIVDLEEAKGSVRL